MPFQVASKLNPVDFTLPGTSRKPLAPDPFDHILESGKATGIANDAIVIVVASQLETKLLVLLRLRRMPIISTPLLNLYKTSPQAIFC